MRFWGKGWLTRRPPVAFRPRRTVYFRQLAPEPGSALDFETAIVEFPSPLKGLTHRHLDQLWCRPELPSRVIPAGHVPSFWLLRSTGTHHGVSRAPLTAQNADSRRIPAGLERSVETPGRPASVKKLGGRATAPVYDVTGRARPSEVPSVS